MRGCEESGGGGVPTLCSAVLFPPVECLFSLGCLVWTENTEGSDNEANLMLLSAAGCAAAALQKIKHEVAEVYGTSELTN